MVKTASFFFWLIATFSFLVFLFFIQSNYKLIFCSDKIILVLNLYLPYLSIILSTWIIILTFLVIKMLSHYRNLTKDVSQKDLISSLNHLISQSTENKESITNLIAKFESEITANKSHFQKLGFKRFNPFSDTGGNQSFCLCLLDENGTGIVISSLHSRENTRIYAKKIEGGKAVNNQVLSKEEQSAVKQAQSGQNI